MTRARAWVVVVVIAGSAATGRPAHAQPAPDGRARATARFKQGQEFFKAGDYDHALAEYDAAYQLSGEPLLIFNIALCHDRAGRPEPALAAFQRYLALAPDGKVADEAREDVVRLTAAVDALHARQAADEADRAAQARRADQARADAEQARRDRDQREARRRALEAGATSLERRSGVERWGGLAGGVLGTISLAAGIKLGLDARAAAREISDHRGPWTDAILARDAEGRTAETRMIVLTSVGGAVIVAGAISYLLGRHHGGEAHRLRLELAPSPSPSGGAAALVVTMSGQL